MKCGRKQKIDDKRFKYLFYVEGELLQKIADEFNVGISALSSFRKRKKLPPRGPSEKSKKAISDKFKGRFIGKRNPTWKTGKTPSTQGYILLSAARFGGPRQILEHRWVMQKHLGRPLTSKEIIHHKNGIKTDNRIENLEIHDRASHASFHSKNKNMKFADPKLSQIP